LERMRAANEDARVLYVAATRAERCLHLIGVAKLNNKGQLNAPKNTFLELLWPHVCADFAASDNVADTGSSASDAHVQNANSLAEFVPKLVRLAAPKLPEVFCERAEAASHIARVTNTTNEVFASAEMDSLDSSLSSTNGILAHRYLELVMKQGVEAWPVARIASLKPAMLKWLQRQGVPTEALEAAADRTIAMLQTTLQSEDGRWLLKPRASASAELPISTWDEDAARTQRLDLTFVEDGVRWIVDYKSTEFAADVNEDVLRQQAETHREQLEGYAKLFEGEGLPVKMAIFFLSRATLVTI
jgi:ATP-dependent helicase/nuclease subunit A